MVCNQYMMTLVTMIITARDTDRLGEGDEITEIEWSIDGTVMPAVTANNVMFRHVHYPMAGMALARLVMVAGTDMAVRVKDNDPNRNALKKWATGPIKSRLPCCWLKLFTKYNYRS